ncbi:bifunctional ATPase [Babesia duncani]|uniref:V-type proton ATPase subunit F n=1 Tax=Babesia duncani TaxID=323732 RepID=A0AAD9PLR8_9APIC|nr:bifunctional ATPase [Babesia duncani]
MQGVTPITDAKIYIIGDEDTVVGFLLAGVGNKDGMGRTNYLIVTPKTTTTQVEDTFKDYYQRKDAGIIIINQHIAETIRSQIDMHAKAIPAILEIPSKAQPYDPNKDSITQRIKVFFGES